MKRVLKESRSVEFIVVHKFKGCRYCDPDTCFILEINRFYLDFFILHSRIDLALSQKFQELRNPLPNFQERKKCKYNTLVKTRPSMVRKYTRSIFLIQLIKNNIKELMYMDLEEIKMPEKKKDMLIRRTKEILANYTDKLTIRQLYYRLVSSQDIPNNRSQYVYLDKILTDYRQKNLEFADLFEDKTRDIKSDIRTSRHTEFSKMIQYKLDDITTDYPYYWSNRNNLQSKITVILLEKQALETIFMKALGPATVLITARGFNSFTQMREFERLINHDNRELHLYIFTDYDDSGMLIEDNFKRQIKEHLGIHFDSIKRVALTKDYIELNNLPTNPTKKTTHSKFNLPYFVELDAIEPNDLKNMVKEICEWNYDKDLYDAYQKYLKIRNRRMKKKYFKELKKIDLSKL